MEKDAGTIFRELKQELSAYIGFKAELLKLDTYERMGKVITILSYGAILLFLAFFAILFIFLALGFFLGDLFESIGAGFASVAVLYILLITIIITSKKKIQHSVLNTIISALISNGEQEEAPKKEEANNEESTTDHSAGTTDC